ncbi:urease accessory protein UreD [Ancylobacter sp. A5.8]|uniref:urease accessory protein UreD n=1 Tax=Ancylobacter gelatini TaxID=2919920 RepID=UPI001F4EE68A|nr:urease accessory protein UreD [Ancylobacter gelatini]MCJ8143214.1 urease accessory protein UreD [Ancylobacter gelatini]
MYATELPSDASPRSTIPVELRAKGRLFVEALAAGGRTVRGAVEEAGPSRVRFPLSGRRGAALEGVLLNTGGGFAGGDSSHVRARACDGAHLVLTTQAAEKIYRSDGALTQLAVELEVRAGARLDWMPQATILFDRARVERSITAEVAGSGRLLLVEPLVLGRTASGETLRQGALFDSWRVRRDGRLIYADGLDLSGDLAAVLGRGAVMRHWAALATILLIAPDAESRLQPVRAALGIGEEATDGLPDGLEAGASAWNGILAVRLLARDGAGLDRAIRRIIRDLGVADPPRIWHS